MYLILLVDFQGLTTNEPLISHSRSTLSSMQYNIRQQMLLRHGFVTLDPDTLHEEDIVAYVEQNGNGWKLGNVLLDFILNIQGKFYFGLLNPLFNGIFFLPQ